MGDKNFPTDQPTDTIKSCADDQTHGDRVTSTYSNKAGYTATLVARGWAGAVLEKVTRAFG